jgi:hypothetical protein
VPLGPPDHTRRLALFETGDSFGRLMNELGTVADGALGFRDPVTENPALDATEMWEVFNTTADTHPIHLHLVQFQVVSRQKFRAVVDPATGLTKVRLLGRPKPPAANETGWKDTVQMPPGEVTRIVARFDRPGKYVWHCHILEHEDYEMMRPYVVGGGTSAAREPTSDVQGSPFSSTRLAADPKLALPAEGMEAVLVPKIPRGQAVFSAGSLEELVARSSRPRQK